MGVVGNIMRGVRSAGVRNLIKSGVKSGVKTAVKANSRFGPTAVGMLLAKGAYKLGKKIYKQNYARKPKYFQGPVRPPKRSKPYQGPPRKPLIPIRPGPKRSGKKSKRSWYNIKYDNVPVRIY